MAALAERFPGVVLTLGAAGASYADADGTRAVAAQPADVLDTTGAGDAFCAGFLATWAVAQDAEAALAAGAAAACHAVTLVGGRPPRNTARGGMES